MAHRGIPARRSQLREYRGQRKHHAGWLAGMAVLLVLVLLIAARH
jgi:hypothetical protein